MAILAALLGISALLIDRKLLFGLGLSDSVVISFAYCMFAVVIGVVSRWQADRAREAEQARRQSERDAIARTLHDRISNDLAYAIMRIDHDGMTKPHELRSILTQALADTHRVIDALDNASDDSDATPAPASHVQFADAIIDCIDEQEARLHALGFNGQTMIAALPQSLSSEQVELIVGLLNEMYTNIAKHGDATHGYVMSIGHDNSNVIITAADTPLQAVQHRTATDQLGIGSGLNRYRNMGIDIQICNDHADQWSMTARIPTATAVAKEKSESPLIA